MKIQLSEEQYRVLVERSKKDNLFNKEDDYKDIRDIISNYTSLNDLAKDNKNLYNRIRTRTPELLDNLERDGGSLTKWNLDNVKELIGNYKTLSDFRNENPKIYKQIKNRKMTQELLGHLQRGGSLEKWDIENVKNIISTYTNLIDFRRNHEHLYNQIKGRGLNDELLGHLEKNADIYIPKYTEDDLRKLAEPFKNKRDFEKKYPTQVRFANKYGLLDKLKDWESLGNLVKRMVYVYEFRDKKGNPLAVYVGLTNDEGRRNKEHTTDWVSRSGKLSPVYKYIVANKIKPTKKIVSNGYIPYKDAIDMECYYQNDFYKKDKREDGSLVWQPLHSQKCGGLGGNMTKWTEEKIRKEAQQYNSISDFYKYSRPAYMSSRRSKPSEPKLWLFNDITKNMTRPIRKNYLVSQNNFNTFLNGNETGLTQLNLLDISCYKKVTSENESKFLQRLKSIIIQNQLSLSGKINQNTLVSLNRKLYEGILRHDKINLNNKWIPYLFPNHVKGIGESKLSFENILTEKLRDMTSIPIYHHTTEERALGIMNSNMLTGSKQYEEVMNLDRTLKQSKHKTMVSFTRDKNFMPDGSIGNSGDGPRIKPDMLNVIFVADRSRLKTRYRVVPFDYGTIANKAWMDEIPRTRKNPEVEERVLTDRIYPLRQYLTNIIYTGQDPEVQKKIDEYLSGIK